jgi:CRP-like cAMP-binding protein
VAESAGVLLSLDAKVFRRVIAQSARSRYDDIYEALKKVPLLWDNNNEEMSNLNEAQLAKIAEIVEVVHYKANTTIIKKGDIGKIFYMIKEGTTTVTDLSTGKPMSDGNLGAGAYFGEQALMSDAPRNATIMAKTDVTLLCLSRELFQSVLGPLKEVMDHNSNMRLLDTVFLFQAGLTNKEKELVYKSFNYEIAKKGVAIVHEGDQGNKFYILKEGSCDVITAADGKTSELVKGAHFGEFALMDDIPRMATVMPTCDCELLTMDRERFAKLVTLKDMKKNLDKARAQLQEENQNKKHAHATNFKFEDLKQMSILGSGTFGRVTLVQDKKSKQTFALKAMLKSEIVAHKQQKNVMHEKNAMITCNNPFVLRLFQTFKDQYKLYMLLEFVQGGELFSVLHPAHPPHGVDGVPDRAAKFYSAGVLIGLSYLHNERNIAYRDMKPENCLIDSKGYPKLVDFGFAKVITSKSYTLCGTPEYLAPELVLGRGHNKAVDYWAFGIMVYEMQSGYSPFSDQNGMDQVVICKNIVKGNLKFEPSFNPECRDLVKKLLNRDAQARLGNLKNGTDDIKNHKWFAKYDWRAYNRKELPAPFVPKITSVLDTSHFDPYAVDDHVEDRSYKDKTDWAKEF